LVAICLHGRRSLFTKPELVYQLIGLLRDQSQAHFFDLYAHCFKPDHCHLLLYGLRSTCDLSNFVRAFRGNAAVLLRKFGLLHVFHDHVIRNDDGLKSSAAYILENPVRAGLV
jgi:putative transposase